MAGPPAQAYLPPQGPGFEVGYASMPGYGPAPQVRHLSTEGHLLALGMWNRVSGFFMLIVGGLLMVMAMVGVLTVSRNAGQAGVFMGAGLFGSAVFLVIGFLVLMLGNALQKFSDTARLVSGALSCLWLVWDVIQLAAVAGSRGAGGATLVALLGIVYTGAVIAVLFSRQAQEVCSVPYRSLVDHTPHLRASMYSSILCFWIPVLPFLLILGGLLVGLASMVMH